AWLYFWNSAGAVVGSLAAGYVLIPTLGLDVTLLWAGAINTVLGIAAIRLARVDARPTPVVEPSAEMEPTYSAWQVRWALAAAALSGFSALALEVAWIRLLAITLGASTYAFCLAVAGFI